MRRAVLALLCLLLLTGCVSSSRYEALLAERDALTAERDELRAAVDALEGEVSELKQSAEELRSYIAGQADEINGLREALSAAEGLSREQQATVDELMAALDAIREQAVRFPLQQELGEAVDGAARGVSDLGSLLSNFLSDLRSLPMPSLPGSRK